MKRDRSKDKAERKERYELHMQFVYGHWIDKRKVEWFMNLVKEAVLTTRQHATPEEWWSICENETIERALLTETLDDEI